LTWRDLEDGAPELAALARRRLEAAGVALLGTIRRDGSPRISPIEPFFVEHELLLGVGARTEKARDLRRDPRCVLHSTVSAADAGEPDLALYARVEPSAARAGWWADRDRSLAHVYALAIERAVYIEWELGAERMRVRSWTPARGETVDERSYP
jgi:Pyridoxamine 5'-phosphate oxidase